MANVPLEINSLPRTGDGGTFIPTHLPPYRIDDEAVLQCAEGYSVPNQPISKVILKNGQLLWEPSGIDCIPISCGAPPILPHARLSNQMFTFPQSFHYVCDEGYTFNGRLKNFFCSPLGQWIPFIDTNTMRCDPVKCPPPKAPENGSVSYVENTFRSIATYTCDKGFILIQGNEQRECQKDGTWSGEDVICGKIPCPDMDPTQIKVLHSTESFNIIDCGNNRLVTVKCLPIGKWALKFPYCTNELEDDFTLRKPVNNIPSQPPALSIQPPAPSIQPPAPSIQPPALSIQPQVFPPVQGPSIQPQVFPPVQGPSIQPQVFPPVQGPSIQPQVFPPVQGPSIQPQVFPPVQGPSIQPQVLPPVQGPQGPSIQPQVLPPVQGPSIQPPALPPVQSPPALPPVQAPPTPPIQLPPPTVVLYPPQANSSNPIYKNSQSQSQIPFVGILCIICLILIILYFFVL